MNKKYMRLLAVIAVAIVGIVGYLIYSVSLKSDYSELANEIDGKEAIINYIYHVSDFVTDVSACEADFLVLDRVFETATGDEMDTEQVSVATLIDSAREMCSSEIASEKKRKSELDELYEDITSVSFDDPQIQRVKKALSDYYKAYEARYDLLVEGNFNASTYPSMDVSTEDQYDEAKREVTSLIEEFNHNLNSDLQ